MCFHYFPNQCTCGLQSDPEVLNCRQCEQTVNVVWNNNFTIQLHLNLGISTTQHPVQSQVSPVTPSPTSCISTKIFFFFKFSFTSLSSFFTHIETNQSVGGAKTGVPGEKPPDTPASRTWLVPHMTRAPSEARTHSGEMIE